MKNVRRPATDYSPPISKGGFAFEYVNQIQNQSRVIRLRMVIPEVNTKSIEASCSKALLHFVNKKLNLDCV